MKQNDIEPRSVTVVGERSRTEPYELPDGWKWTRLGDVCETSKEKIDVFSQEMKYVGLENIDSNGKINGWSSAGEIKSLKNIFHKNQILYGKLRPYLNKHDIAKFDGVCSTDILVFNAKKDFSNKYINYFFNLPYFIDFVVSNSKGINLPRVSEKTILEIPFPLPPTLAEQQRIVSRIESLFTKLDEAKDKAQSVADGFELRRAAILHKAFTGELTAKWRKENGVSDDSWEEKTIGECLITISDKYDPEKDKIEGIQYIGLENIEANGGIISTGDASSVKSIKTLFKSNDLLYGKLRPYLDKHDISDFDGICSTDILVYRSKIGYEIKFFNYLFSQKRFIQYAVENSKGINLPRTSEKSVSAYSQKIPTLAEQQEIVRILDTVLEKETRAKEAAGAVLDQIDLLKKSILARAFRGEL